MKKIILDGHEIEISDESFEAFKKEFIKEPKDRAKKGDGYYRIGSLDSIDCLMEDYDSVDDYYYNIGNYYLTKEEAERALEIQKILLQYRYKFTKEELEDVNTKKWFIYCDNYYKKLIIGCTTSYPRTATFFKTEEDAQKAIDEIGYDDYLQYCVRGNIK